MCTRPFSYLATYILTYYPSIYTPINLLITYIVISLYVYSPTDFLFYPPTHQLTHLSTHSTYLFTQLPIYLPTHHSPYPPTLSTNISSLPIYWTTTHIPHTYQPMYHIPNTLRRVRSPVSTTTTTHTWFWSYTTWGSTRVTGGSTSAPSRTGSTRDRNSRGKTF